MLDAICAPDRPSNEVVNDEREGREDAVEAGVDT